MGVVIGLFGTVLWLVITGLVVVGGLAAGAVALLMAAAMFIVTQPEIIEVTSDMFNVTIAAVEYEDKNGNLPDDIAVLSPEATTLTDPWGNPYRYRLADKELGFDVISNGVDGVAGTDDDMSLSRMDRIWEDAFEGFGSKMEEFGNRMQALDNRSHRVKVNRTSHAKKSCGPKHDEPTPAERYEAAAVAAAVAESVAQEVTAIAAPTVEPAEAAPDDDTEAEPEAQTEEPQEP